MKHLIQAVTFASAIVAGPAFAASWTLVPESSHLAYGSIKKDTVGEVNSFTSLSGQVSPDGQVEVEIDLSSVETNIDIRNERMIEYVFRKAGTATLTAKIDMENLTALEVGQTTTLDSEAALSLVGTDVEFDAELFVARLTENSVLVTTSDMVFVSTEDAGVNAGIDKLMELADLPGITRTVPVTARFVFHLDDEQASIAPVSSPQVAAVALDGDVKAGKKVFRKCSACHQVKEGRNGVGPSLFGIIGAQAAQVDGFRYSEALQESGITWTSETLSTFLRDPRGVVLGNKMQFPGLKKDEDIVNLLAYLRDQATG